MRKNEKMVICLVDLNDYKVFRCEKDGVYAIPNINNHSNCPACKKPHSPMINIRLLQNKYRAELGLPPFMS